jgi:hypothetical protein
MDCEPQGKSDHGRSHSLLCREMSLTSAFGRFCCARARRECRAIRPQDARALPHGNAALQKEGADLIGLQALHRVTRGNVSFATDASAFLSQRAFHQRHHKHERKRQHSEYPKAIEISQGRCLLLAQVLECLPG